MAFVLLSSSQMLMLHRPDSQASTLDRGRNLHSIKRSDANGAASVMIEQFRDRFDVQLVRHSDHIVLDYITHVLRYKTLEH